MVSGHSFTHTDVMVVVVHCEAAGLMVCNNHRLCSERRLLFKLELEAKNAGRKGERISQYIRQKTGGCIKIWRRTADGEYANASPCILCTKCIEKHGLRVLCSIGKDTWFNGVPTSETSKFTRIQKMNFDGNQRHLSFPINMKF
jgi:hypothetical protein